MSILTCPYSGICGGCAWGGRPLEEQNEQKLAEVRALFPEAQFVYSPNDRVRDRADLIWEEGRLGLYRQNERTVLDIEACVMMTPQLEAFFKEFRKRKPPIRKGSVRLRVSPQGEWGVWLDFANQDVKTLFEEKEYLRWLSSIAFVEIGQRRKHLIWKDDQPKLTDPELKAWFETAGGKPLYGPVGGFSQAGFAANRALTAAVLELAQASGVKDWVELFCGNGNFTKALAGEGLSVEAVEMDELALEGLAKDLPPQVKISRADVYLKTKSLPALSERGLLVDPPRAGLRETVPLVLEQQPPVIIYVSCFTDTFLADVEKLGYRREKILGVNQFPHSPHTEWVALLTRP